MITVNQIDETTFDVTVESKQTTTHRVVCPDDYFQELTSGKCSKMKLIEESFEFLLKRESNTMIFSEFNLPVIQSYFQEYENTFKKKYL